MQTPDPQSPVQDSRLLLLPISLYLIIAITYMFYVPVGESPDEPGHLQCVEQVSRLRRLPIVDPQPAGAWYSRETVLSGHMCYHMPLYYVVAGAFHHVTGRFSGDQLHFEFPPNNQNFEMSSSLFVHEKKRHFWNLSEPLNVSILRIQQILIGATLLWASYKIARTLFPQEEMVGVGAAVLVAGWPQYVFMSRAISNDILATALAVVVLVILLQTGRPSRFVPATIFAALAILTKLNMLFILVPFAVGFIMEVVGAQERRREYVKPGLVSAAIFLLPVMLIVVHPTLRTHFQQTVTSFGGTLSHASNVVYWFAVLGITLRSGWAQFGWMNVPTAAWQSTVWWAFLSVAALIGVRQLIVHERAASKWCKRVVLAIILLWVAGSVASFLRINVNRFQPQFRFMFPLIPVLTSLAIGGYFQLFCMHKKQRVLSIVGLTVLLLGANLSILIFAVIPAYS